MNPLTLLFGPKIGIPSIAACGTLTDDSPSEEEAKEVDRLPVARVPVDARLLREETSRDPILSRVVHFTLNGWPGKEEVPDNLKSYYFQRNELTVEEGGFGEEHE